MRTDIEVKTNRASSTGGLNPDGWSFAASGSGAALHAAVQRAHERISIALADGTCRLPIVLCYVDYVYDCLAIGFADTTAAIRRARRELSALAGGVPLRAFRCAPAVRHANKTAHNRPLVGGLLLWCPAGGGINGKGTLCIAATRSGVEGFVTCGHVVGAKNSDVYQPQSTSQQFKVGSATEVTNYNGVAASDSAFVKLESGVDVTKHAIWKSASTTYTVSGISAAPAFGTDVSMQGASTATTLRSGKIRGENVTVTFSDGGKLTGQLLADYKSEKGDSGAPVFTGPQAGSSVELVGMNVGAAEPDDVDPAPNPKWLPQDGAYAVISPWANIKSDLGLD